MKGDAEKKKGDISFLFMALIKKTKN